MPKLVRERMPHTIGWCGHVNEEKDPQPSMRWLIASNRSVLKSHGITMPPLASRCSTIFSIGSLGSIHLSRIERATSSIEKGYLLFP
jgi:hypothetical protein